MDTPQTAVDYEHSTGLVPLLRHLRVSLVVSTYQAGKVITVGAGDDGRADIRFHHFEQAMGLARAPDGLTVGTRKQIWHLPAAPDLAATIDPPGTFDVAFLARTAHFTGPIMGHDLAWCRGELWVANTLFSCLATVRPGVSFVPRWRPPFVTALAAEDRCHLNGMAADADGPRYVTALGATDTAAGWRPGKATGGVLIDVASGETVLRGLSMPHSPRLAGGALWLLDSGHGRLGVADVAQRKLRPVIDLPGYARGLDVFGGHAFVGLSRIRETNVFGGLPIAERRGELKCGVAVVDLAAGRVAATLEFKSGVEEVFEVRTLPGFVRPFLSGPNPESDGTEAVWVVPPPEPAR